MADTLNSSAGDTAAHASANPIALGHVLALSVPVHWTEAVAVVEELCLTLTATDGETALVPDPQDVLITAQGALMVRRGAPPATDVEGVGRILNALLDPVTTPIPLRLFVAHSIGSEKYRSVTAYGEALAYYARPDRTELIQALYRRCLESSGPVVIPVLPEPVRLEVTPPAVVPVPPPLVQRRRIPRWLPAAAAAAMLLIVIYFGTRHFIGGSAPSPVGTLVAAAAGVMRSVTQLVSQAPPAGVPSQPVEAETRTPAPAPAPQPGRSRRAATAALPTPVQPSPSGTTRVLTPEPSAISNTFVLVPSPPQILAPQLLTPISTPTVTEGALALAPGETILPVRIPAVEPKVYNKASRDVQPPVMYSPKLPPLAPAEPNAIGTNTMELLIDETGIVQQVLLVSQPVRLNDMTLLSAAKVWKFYPALKDGQPVPYRLSVSWVVTPP